MRYGMLALFASTLATLAACGEATPPAEAPAAPAAEAPPVDAAAAPAAAGSVTGTVLETMNAATYTYVRIKTETGEVWAAVPETKTAVGESITIVNPMTMTNFTSKTLNRTFDSILFGQLGGAAGAAAPAGDSPMVAMPSMPAADPVDTTPINVTKATGADARTVAELWAEKAKLKGGTVTIHGKVVKSTSGVMGKNWLHLRDGTGSAAGPDNDITITTQGTAAVGDVVTVKGTVTTDKDFGAGYSYVVIVEDATVTK